jgi:sodium transport system permease protein
VRPALIIFFKEAREMLRDKRVVNAAFVAPVFMIILFVLVFGLIETKVKRKPDLRLAFVRDAGNPLIEALEKSGEVKVTLVDSVQEGLGLMDEGKVRAVVEFGPDFAAALGRGDAKVTAHYESTEPLSSIAMAAVRGIVEQMNKESARTVMSQNGIDRKLAEPIAFEQKDVQKQEGLGASMIVSLVPYLIVLWAFYGGFSTVTDLVAGEKERGTMETLLVSPVTRNQVALGKFLALSVICLVSSLTTLVGVLAVGLLKLDLTKALFPSGLDVSFLAVVEMFGVLIPLVVLFASMLIAVSAYAKNAREAQTYLTLVSFVVLMPAIFSQFIGFTGAKDEAWVRLTPVLNSAVALKEALLDELALDDFLMTVGVSLVLGLLMLKVAFWLFRREQILTRV